MDVKYNLEKLKKLYSEFGMGLVLIKIILIIVNVTEAERRRDGYESSCSGWSWVYRQ